MLIEKLVLDVIFCVIVSGISEIFSSFKKKKKIEILIFLFGITLISLLKESRPTGKLCHV